MLSNNTVIKGAAARSAANCQLFFYAFGVTLTSETLNSRLLIEADLLEGSVLSNSGSFSEIPAAVFIKKLTWHGHDFLDAIRQESVWQTIKSEFKEVKQA